MAKQSVDVALPIEFSEVVEVVYQSTSGGTSGRSLSTAFTKGDYDVSQGTAEYDANYVGNKDRLTNFRGYTLVNPQTYTVMPSFKETGRLATSTLASVDVPYPANVLVNDILLMKIYDVESDTINVPAGWTSYSYINPNSTANTFRTFWKRATGIETGTVTVTTNTTVANNLMGHMISFKDCITEGIPFTSPISTVSLNVDHVLLNNSANTLYPNQLAVSFTAHGGSYVGNDDLQGWILVSGAGHYLIGIFQCFVYPRPSEGTNTTTGRKYYNSAAYGEAAAMYLIPNS